MATSVADKRAAFRGLHEAGCFVMPNADCLYAPGIREESEIRAVVQAVAPKPVNLLSTGIPVATAERWGVRRISVGGALAGIAYGTFYAAAREIVEQGTFGGLTGAAGGRTFNPIFSR